MNRHTRRGITARAIAVWLVLIVAEILHGIARGIFLVPHVSEFRSSQIGVFTGSVIILVIALVFVRWIGATRTTDLLAVGVLWLGLTLAFEILFGRFVVGASWERLAADYNVLEGGLLPFGMLVLALSPPIAAKLRAAINDQAPGWPSRVGQVQKPMTTFTDNPYQSPQAIAAGMASSEKPAEVSWKQIARRWEILRLVYNLIVGLAGVLTLGMMPNLMAASVIGGVVAFGFCANVMYLLGPVTEMYLNWIVDAWEGRWVPRWLAGFVRSRYLTGLLFVGGCLFSVGLTLAIGISEAFAAMLPNQQ